MLNKKILAIVLNLVLAAGTIVCVGHAKEDDSLGIDASPAVMESVAPAPVMVVPQVEISMEQEDKYMGLGDKIVLSAEVTGIPEGMPVIYQWSKKDGGKWEDIEKGTGKTIQVTFSKPGKIKSVYCCYVKAGASEDVYRSNELVVSKIVYKRQLKVNLGQSFTVEDILCVPLKESEEVVKGRCYPSDNKKNESQCISTSKKEGKKIFTVIKYYKKIPFDVELGKDGREGAFTSIVLVKKPAMKDYKKDIKIKLAKKKTRLTAKFENIAGISVIQFRPQGLEKDTIKKKEGNENCTVVYRYKAKFKMKKFAVRYGYQPLGSKKVKYTKWVNVSI